MGFFSFLKSKKEKIERELIKFEELDSWIINKRNKITVKEEALLNQQKISIAQLVQDISEKIEPIKNINWSEKKVDERIKLIVKGNLMSYVSQLTNFIDRLNSLNPKNFHEMELQINSVVSYFEKSSSLNFQKASFIIGQELEDIRKVIAEFLKEINIIRQNNKELLANSKSIDFIMQQLDEIRKINNLNSELKNTLIDYDTKIINGADKIKDIYTHIAELKQTKEYSELIHKQAQFKEKKHELDRELYMLKEIIDFKFLAKKFHSDPGYMQAIKNYKSDFKQTFFQDDGAALIKLIDEAKLNVINISAKIATVLDKQKELVAIQIDQDKTINLGAEISKLNLEIEQLRLDKEKTQIKYNKSVSTIKKFADIIRSELFKIGVDLN